MNETDICSCGHTFAEHHRFHPHECWSGRCVCPAFERVEVPA